MVFIIVKNKIEGIHRYKDAPEPVGFLRYPHRHVFYVKSAIQVFHDDRELEFLMVQREIQRFLLNLLPGTEDMSCEMIAREVQKFLKTRYPVPVQEAEQTEATRMVQVTVMEDNENGAWVTDSPVPIEAVKQVSGACFVCGAFTSTRLIEGGTDYFLCRRHLYEHVWGNFVVAKEEKM